MPPRVAERAVPIPAATGGGGVPGTDPAGQRAVDVPALAYRELRAEQAAAPAQSPGIAPTLRPAAPAEPRPNTGGSAGIIGRVYDLTYGQPIRNVTIFLVPFIGGCTNATCTTNSTTTPANGSFTLGAPPGAYTLGFGAPLYLSNETWVTLSAGRTLNVGILFLVHEGYARGVVEAATPGHAPLAGVSVTSQSRDGQLQGNPPALTAANGSFLVPVPPLPSQISFSPPQPANRSLPSPYLTNVTYSNATPYSTVDVGTIYLEGGVAVNATLYDEATGRPIAPNLPSQLTVCVRPSSFCLSPILDHSGPNVTGWGMPGAASVIAYAIGYVVNSTPVADLPNTNGTVDLGPIYLLPMGVAEISANVTGGDPTGGVWPVGDVNASVCSLNGEEVAIQAGPGGPMSMGDCWPTGAWSGTSTAFAIGATAYAPGPPLHDAIVLNTVASSETLPVAYTQVNQYAPKFPTRFSNLTWANLTPDQVTVVGSVDLLAGSFLEGNVSVPGVTGPLAGTVSVTVCQEGDPLVCADPGRTYGLGGPVPNGCSASNRTFCIAAPPGPDRVVVTGFGGLVSNRTWVDVPSGCCAQEGHPIDLGWVNLSGYGQAWGSVSGTVASAANGAPPGGFATTITVCPVGPAPVGGFVPACQSAPANATTGAFNLTAPLGWDQVAVSTTGFQQNWSWIDVTGANTTGRIDLTPDAVLGGRVVAPDGSGLYEAVVQVCEMGAAVSGAQCLTLGATNTYGQYNGTLRGGPLPWGSYEVVATAAGFAQNWTWVNTSVDAVSIASPITLWPLGFGSGPARPRVAATVSVGAWVQGRLVDNRTGFGIPSATVQACAIVTGLCSPVGLTSYGGTFNVSMQTGYYDLEFAPTGYTGRTVFVNGTTPLVDLGAIRIAPYPWASGRVLLGPWTNLTAVDGIGPALTFVACASAYAGPCGPATTTNSGGFFNMSFPSTGGVATVSGNGVFGFGSANEAYGPYQLGLPATTAPFVDLPTSAPSATVVELFGAVVGVLRDGSGYNVSLNASSRPAPFTEVQVEVYHSSFNPFNVMQTGAGGNYVAFIPLGTSELIHGFGATYFTAAEYAAGVDPGTVLDVPPINVPAYGWVTARFIDSGSGTPLVGVPVTVSYLDAANATPIQVTEVSNGVGFVNVSAPPMNATTVAWGLPGYLNNSTTVAVAQRHATGLGVVSLVAGGRSLYAWVQSEALGSAVGPPVATVVDAKTHAPLPDAIVTPATPYGPAAPSARTNGLGQFLLYAPTLPTVGISFQMPGYDGQLLSLNLSLGGRTVVPRVNLTGNGIVAGRIVAEPGNVPVGDIQVSVCPAQFPGCSEVAFTNGSGVFWVAASAGADVVTVTSAAYLANVTRGVTVPTDGFVSVGAIPVYAFGQVSGVVRAIPTGFAVPNANVSICSPFAPIPLGCFLSVGVGANGSFVIPIPPSTYLLYVTAPYFNASVRLLSVLPGEHLSIGTVLLVSYGVVMGRAVSLLDGAPAPNATAIVCAQAPAVGCSAPENGTADGRFLLVAPPGPGDLTVSAPGFLDNYSSVTVPAGGTLDVGAVGLLPTGPAVPETIRGRVLAANPSDAPIAGAAVTATQNGATAASGTTDGNGTFALTVYWGSFELSAAADGFRTNRTALVVHGNVTGLTFLLATMTYPVSGTVTDAATGVPLAGVEIFHAGTLLAESDALGRYAFDLPNGSYALATSTTSRTGETYDPLTLVVTVNGASVVRDIALVASTWTITGAVVDALTGLPIAAAVVTAIGPALPGPGHSLRAVTDAEGGFHLLLPPGAYTLNVSAPGYLPLSEAIALPLAPGSLALALSPAAGGPVGSAPSIPILLGLAAGIVAAVVLAALLWRRRPPAAAPPPEPMWAYEIAESAAPDSVGPAEVAT